MNDVTMKPVVKVSTYKSSVRKGDEGGSRAVEISKAGAGYDQAFKPSSCVDTQEVDSLDSARFLLSRLVKCLKETSEYTWRIHFFPKSSKFTYTKPQDIYGC